MNVLFFQTNFLYVKDFLRKNQNSVAFWYAEGLSSYLMLKDVIAVEKVYIEQAISVAFRSQYTELLNGTLIEEFESSTEKILETSKKKIFFLPSNDTHVYLFQGVIKQLDKSNYQYKLYCKEGEHASSAAQKLNLPVHGNETNILPVSNDANLVVFGNDWGLVERNISNEYLNCNVNTVCIQESLLDLNPDDRRLMNCSFPIFQGLNSLKSVNLKQKICAVIGNPRFETLEIQPLPENKKVFINVNFTYGIFEEVRMSWIQDILSTLTEVNVDYIISQHPRDNGDLKNFKLLKSNAGIVHNTIKESSVVISRFSALLLESICMGRPAIYYNPHGEQMNYKLEPDNKVLFYATNPAELKDILIKIFATDYIFMGNDILNFHLGNTSEGLSSKFIAHVIRDLTKQPTLKKISLFEGWIVKLKLFKRYILRK